MNELVVVMDSAGFNEFDEAYTPFLSNHGVNRATSFAPYTMPSVQAMLRGSLPQPKTDRYFPYKDYVKSEHAIIPMSLGRQDHHTFLVSSNINITSSLTSYNDGKEVVGYLPWFEHEFTKLLPARNMFSWFLQNLREPFYCFMLLIDTHTPYGFRKLDDEEGYTRENQIKAIEYVDHVLKRNFKRLPSDTRMIVTSDHSDCWVDGKRYGHNPKHYCGMVQKNLINDLLDVFIVEVKK
jgi:hypothetical protein